MLPLSSRNVICIVPLATIGSEPPTPWIFIPVIGSILPINKDCSAQTVAVVQVSMPMGIESLSKVLFKALQKVLLGECNDTLVWITFCLPGSQSWKVWDLSSELELSGSVLDLLSLDESRWTWLTST